MTWWQILLAVIAALALGTQMVLSIMLLREHRAYCREREGKQS